MLIVNKTTTFIQEQHYCDLQHTVMGGMQVWRSKGEEALLRMEKGNCDGSYIQRDSPVVLCQHLACESSPFWPPYFTLNEICLLSFTKGNFPLLSNLSLD